MKSIPLIALKSYPDYIAKRLERIKQKGGAEIHTDANYTYVMLATGERPTGGYRIEGLEAEELPSAGGNYVQITAKEIRPKPGAVLIQVLTYPTAVYRIPKTNLPVQVNWVRT